MNGPASDASRSHTLIISQETPAIAPSDSTGAGAGSTSIPADTDSSVQDSPARIDQNSATSDVANVSPNTLASTDQHDTLTSPGTENEIVQKAEVAEPRSGDKGGESEPANVLVGALAVKEEGEVLLESVDAQIELLEHTPEVGVGSGDPGLIVEEGQEWIPDPDHELKRVKVSRPHDHAPLSSSISGTYGLWLVHLPDLLAYLSVHRPHSAVNLVSIMSWSYLSSTPGLRAYWVAMDRPRNSLLLWPVLRRN